MICISLLFDSLISHGYVPKDFLLSTLVPIPKNKRKSLNCSDNYRAIALSSGMGKLLDHILLVKCKDVFKTSPYQFGFKKSHSTSQCTFVVNETIQYYMNNDSNVYVTLLDASRAFDRVEYVKLFKLLISRGICPIVARFLITLYTNQIIRVKWGTSISMSVSICNGVKQGGVMSPILFTVYIDELLYRLSNSHCGCFIGNQFHGAYGYADDVILLAPSLYSLRRLLNICSTYAHEFNVLFNSSKSKLITFSSNRESPSPRIEFMNGVIDVVPYDKHLGNYIGNINKNDVISHTTNDFLCRVNMLKSHFKCIPTDLMYFLFKTYCMPIYGSQLWDLSSPAMNIFNVAWRKSIRYILSLPRTTHCALLSFICNDVPLMTQLCNRFLNFFISLKNNNNPLVYMCYKLIMEGSRSAVSNSLSFICHVYKCNRHVLSIKNIVKSLVTDCEEAIKSSVIRDSLNMKHCLFNSESFFNDEELRLLLHDLCTC